MGVLLGVHGTLVRARQQLVHLQSLRRKVGRRSEGRPDQESGQLGPIPTRQLPSGRTGLSKLTRQYFNRWANHQQSAKLDAEFFKNTEKKMEAMQQSGNLSWIEVQFAKEAVETVIQARITLKWTYALAF
jgi:hypothetical protein